MANNTLAALRQKQKEALHAKTAKTKTAVVAKMAPQPMKRTQAAQLKKGAAAAAAAKSKSKAGSVHKPKSELQLPWTSVDAMLVLAGFANAKRSTKAELRKAFRSLVDIYGRKAMIVAQSRKTILDDRGLPHLPSDARVFVRQRDVRFGTRSILGNPENSQGLTNKALLHGLARPQKQEQPAS